MQTFYELIVWKSKVHSACYWLGRIFTFGTNDHRCILVNVRDGLLLGGLDGGLRLLQLGKAGTGVVIDQRTERKVLLLGEDDSVGL